MAVLKQFQHYLLFFVIFACICCLDLFVDAKIDVWLSRSPNIGAFFNWPGLENFDRLRDGTHTDYVARFNSTGEDEIRGHFSSMVVIDNGGRGGKYSQLGNGAELTFLIPIQGVSRVKFFWSSIDEADSIRVYDNNGNVLRTATGKSWDFGGVGDIWINFDCIDCKIKKFAFSTPNTIDADNFEVREFKK